MRRGFIYLLIIILAFVTSAAFAQGRTVELVVYSSPICGSCQIFDTQILPLFEKAYGPRLKIIKVDVSTAEGLAELERLETSTGLYNNPLPVLWLEGEILANEDLSALREALRQRLEALLGPAEGLESEVVPLPSPSATSGPTSFSPYPPNALAIHVAYISKPGCDVCDRAAIALGVLAKEYPLVIHTFDQAKDAPIIEAMGDYLGLSPERRLIAPSVYIGQDALIYEEITSERLRAILARYVETGAPPFWETLDPRYGAQSIISRFRSMGIVTVIAAGLIDGVNPCAFATIIFFISYLAVSRRPARERLAIGLMFTAGVFVTYLSVGLGAAQVLEWVQRSLRPVGLALYALLGAGCFVLAWLSFQDARLARQGRLAEMRLNLPEAVRQRIHGRIRASRQAYWATSFLSGVLISFLELACTGQIYLPTISFVVGVPELRASATAYLLVYNIAFIAPLLVILFLATYGASTRRLQGLLTRHAAGVKIAMGVLFIVLGGLLLWQAST